MDVFGDHWKDHPRVIAENWRHTVGMEDVVLVPGDISWAMKMDQLADDAAYLARLPGSLVVIRGNHDYWWDGISKVRAALPANVHAVQNDHWPLDDQWAVCGTRGWNLPGGPDFAEHDVKIYERELLRLENSLHSAVRDGHEHLVAMLHYPPVGEKGEPTGFSELLEEYKVASCVYGHLHGSARRQAFEGKARGVQYRLVACDAIDFTPVPLDLPL